NEPPVVEPLAGDLRDEPVSHDPPRAAHGSIVPEEGLALSAQLSAISHFLKQATRFALRFFDLPSPDHPINHPITRSQITRFVLYACTIRLDGGLPLQ
ncbi:MAG: hypothetical protein M3R62_09025, partial [Acidobacteriota bacterium]|nr:hypothetical protein [Acidobacteriota bacterium]